MPATVPTWAERLAQAEVWHNSHGIPVPIEVMDRRYRLNVLSWLWRHADRIAETVQFYYLFLPGPRGDAALDAFEDAMEWLERDPVGYLAETPLIRALLGADLARVTVDPEPPDPPEISASDVIDYLVEILARGDRCSDAVLEACHRALISELRVEYPDDADEWNRALRRVFNERDPRLGPEPDL